MSKGFLKQSSSQIFNISPNGENNLNVNRSEKLLKNSSEYTFNNNYINNNENSINTNNINNKNDELNNFEVKYKNVENPFTPPETMKDDKKEKINDRIIKEMNKNIIGGQRYKKSEKIQNIANELEKIMFGKIED